MGEKNRINSLDVLRGLMASGIMVFHNYITFFRSGDSSSLIEKIGIYGVSIFYVLSGLTLYLVYKDSLRPEIKSISSFFIRRIFRIYPLMWLVIFLTMIAKGYFHPWKVVVLNLTGLFGFVFRTDYIAVGQWSIGNELVFYLFFPLFFFLSRFSRVLFYISLLISLGVGLYFCFYVLQPAQTLANQWDGYIHPMNQLCLFSGGIFIGFLIHKVNFSKHSIAIRTIFFASLLAFIFIPVAGDTINLVTGLNRILYLLICYLICFTSYFQKFNAPTAIRSFFTRLGEASYSIYLLHPIFTILVKKHFPDLSPILSIGICILSSLLTSFVVYASIEKYFMALGRKIAKFTVSK